MRSARLLFATIFLAASATVIPQANGSSFGVAPGLPSDFNGDGFPDLAIGVAGEDVETPKPEGGEISVGDAGAVNVLYGTADGLGPDGNQFFTQDTEGVPDEAEENDWFGSALTTGDFNGDSFSDLAVSAPGETILTETANLSFAGVVIILYGSPDGLTGAGSQLFSQNEGTTGEAAEDQDRFGTAVAAGDVNGDGHDDLAVGVWGEDVDGAEDAGVVHVIYGSAAGLTPEGNQVWSQNSPDIKETAEEDDRFGFSLAIGNFDKSPHDDLAIGSFAESVGTTFAAGAVHVLYGTDDGLTAAGSQLWTQNSPGVPSKAGLGNAFGDSLAAANFGHSSRDDLAIRSRTLFNGRPVGRITVLYGTPQGLTGEDSQLISRHNGDQFIPGFTIAAGNVGKSGHADLAIGTTLYEDSLGTPFYDTPVFVWYGSKEKGLKTTGGDRFAQGDPDVPGDVANGDDFGADVAFLAGATPSASSFAVSTPHENFESPNIDVGTVHVLYGSTTGVTTDGVQLWTQDSPGILDEAEGNDQFGLGLDGIFLEPLQ